MEGNNIGPRDPELENRYLELGVICGRRKVALGQGQVG